MEKIMLDPEITCGINTSNGKAELVLNGGGEKRDAVWIHWYGTHSFEEWLGISLSRN